MKRYQIGHFLIVQILVKIAKMRHLEKFSNTVINLLDKKALPDSQMGGLSIFLGQEQDIGLERLGKQAMPAKQRKGPVTQCLKITKNVAFDFFNFGKLDHFWHFNELLFTLNCKRTQQLASIAMLNETFSVIFKHH